MKIRKGFISNSSSSSFIIFSKNPVTKEKIKEMVIPECYISRRYDDIAAEIIFDSFSNEYCTYNNSKVNNKEELDVVLNDCPWGVKKDVVEKFVNEKYPIYVCIGSFSDDSSDPIERGFCAGTVDKNIITDDFIYIHEGGY